MKKILLMILWGPLLIAIAVSPFSKVTYAQTATPLPTNTPAPTAAPICGLPTSGNTATMQVSLPEANTYYVWSRMIVPDGVNNSFYLQVDGGCAMNVGDARYNFFAPNVLTWVNYVDATTTKKIAMSLSAGTHTVTMTQREPGVGVDKILFTTSSTCVPTGTGSNCDIAAAAAAAATTPTPTTSPLTATIKASPATASLTNTNEFTVAVVVDGGGKAFNAAQATVTVSNLTVTGLSNPTTGGCNFNYAGTAPSASNPSFAGAILNSSSTQCTVYNLTVKPTSTSTGLITFTNGSVKAYSDNSEILSSVQNGTYTVNIPTATPVPTTAPLTPTVAPTNTPIPTATPLPTPTPLPTAVPTAAPTPTPTVIPTAAPPDVPTPTTEPLYPPTIGSVSSPTYQTSLILAGSRTTAVTKIYINNSTDSVTYASSTSWQKTLSLNLGQNDIDVLGENASGTKTAPVSIKIVRNKLSDIDGDNTITLTDISLFGADWLKTSNLSNRLSDMNEDGIVNLTDFSIIAKQYGQ